MQPALNPTHPLARTSLPSNQATAVASNPLRDPERVNQAQAVRDQFSLAVRLPRVSSHSATETAGHGARATFDITSAAFASAPLWKKMVTGASMGLALTATCLYHVVYIPMKIVGTAAGIVAGLPLAALVAVSKLGRPSQMSSGAEAVLDATVCLGQGIAGIPALPFALVGSLAILVMEKLWAD